MSLKRSKVIQLWKQFVKEFSVDPSTTALVAGSAMVIYRLRDQTDDVDLQVSQKDFDHLKSSGHHDITFGYVKSADGVSLPRLVVEPSFDIMATSYQVEVIDGVTVQSIDALLAMKKGLASVLNRPKDREDVAAIERYKASGSKANWMKRW